SLTEHVAEYAADSEIVKEQLAEPSVNVFTGEKFGEESSEDGFDTDSLFTVDEEKLQEAFGFDESAFSNLGDSLDFSGLFADAGSSLDLSGMTDLGNIQVNLPDMPAMSMGDLLGSLDLDVSSDGFSQMAASLMEGYQQYAQEHPEADYSGLSGAFQEY